MGNIANLLVFSRTNYSYNCIQVTGAIKLNNKTTSWQKPFRKPWTRIELRLLSQRTLMLGQDCNREWATLGEMRLISERASEKVAVTSRNQERPWTTMRLSRGCDRLTNRRRWNRRVVTVANVVDSSYYLAFVCAGLTISYVLNSWRTFEDILEIASRSGIFRILDICRQRLLGNIATFLAFTYGVSLRLHGSLWRLRI